MELPIDGAAILTQFFFVNAKDLVCNLWNKMFKYLKQKATSEMEGNK